jgi:hypothetical protein
MQKWCCELKVFRWNGAEVRGSRASLNGVRGGLVVVVMASEGEERTMNRYRIRTQNMEAVTQTTVTDIPQLDTK